MGAWEDPSKHTHPTSVPEPSFKTCCCPFKSSQPPPPKSIFTSFYWQLIQGAKFSYQMLQMLIFPPGTIDFAGGAALATEHLLPQKNQSRAAVKSLVGRGLSSQHFFGGGGWAGCGREGASSGRTVLTPAHSILSAVSTRSAWSVLTVPVSSWDDLLFSTQSNKV